MSARHGQGAVVPRPRTAPQAVDPPRRGPFHLRDGRPPGHPRRQARRPRRTRICHAQGRTGNRRHGHGRARDDLDSLVIRRRPNRWSLANHDRHPNENRPLAIPGCLRRDHQRRHRRHTDIDPGRVNRAESGRIAIPGSEKDRSRTRPRDGRCQGREFHRTEPRAEGGSRHRESRQALRRSRGDSSPGRASGERPHDRPHERHGGSGRRLRR